MSKVSDLSLFRAKTVVPVDRPPVGNGCILVKGGRIVEIGSSDDLGRKYPREKVYDFGDSVILPGLINLHAHVELESLPADPRQACFSDWLKKVVADSRKFDESAWLDSARRGVMRLLSGGMTAAADISRRGAGVQAMRETGLRGTAFFEVVAVDTAGFAQARRELIANLQSASAGPTILVGVSPHSPYSLSAGVLRELVELARELQVPVSIHVAETMEEVNMIKFGSGPLADLFNSYIDTEISSSGTGFSPVAYLNSLSVLTGRTLAVHCVYVDEEDLRFIKRQGTAVVLCPGSNETLGVGEPPAALVCDSGVRFGVGTDSAVSNSRMDIFRELRAVRDIADRQSAGRIRLSAKKLLRTATIEAAEILGLENRIGSLTPGKSADMAVVKTQSKDGYGVIDKACRDDIVATVLGGKIVYRHHFLF